MKPVVFGFRFFAGMAFVAAGLASCSGNEPLADQPTPAADSDDGMALPTPTAACSPQSCEMRGASCGVVDDGCGHLMDCGSCDEPRFVTPPEEDIYLDVRADGVRLIGRELPAPVQSDAPRLLTVQWVANGESHSWAFDDARLQDARFVPHTSGALVIDARGTLHWIADAHSAPKALDHDVIGPLAIASRGRFVAYARGEAPFLDLVRYDLSTGRAEVLVADMAPLWNPAISPDGGDVVFVSGVDGHPALFHRGPEKQTRRIAEAPDQVNPFPEGPFAPIWMSDAIVYQQGDALRVLGFDGRERASIPGWRSPLLVAGEARVLVRPHFLGSTLTAAPKQIAEVIR